MGFLPVATVAQQLAGATIPGALTTTGTITSSAGNINAPLGSVNAGGPIDVTGLGQGLQVKEGANAKQGRAVLVAGAVTVADTSVTAASEIFPASQVDGGTPGFLRISTRTAGTSFTITSGSGTDTSTAAYEIFEPG